LSAQKGTGKLSLWYHDLVCRYNGHFNAKLILHEALARQTVSAKDDYTRILPLRPYEAMEDNTAIYADLDRVIKKSSVAIGLHKNSKWVDDCYLMVGKAKYLRGDYLEALAAFQTITAKYDQGIREKSKRLSKKKLARIRKKEEAGVNIYYDATLPFMRHKPARWVALVWIVRCYTALEKSGEAQSVISLIEGDKTFPDQLQEELQLAIAEMHLKDDRYAAAASAIEKARLVTKGKKNRARYTFILGQLQERTEQVGPAITTFTNVVNMKPGYEMEFQAEMRIVRLSAQANAISQGELIARLGSMLKNTKYQQFLDEIYYAMAEVYLSQGKSDSAIANLKLSVHHSRINTHTDQQAKGYLKLADIYFDNEVYTISKAYHDSALAILNNQHPDYSRVNTRKNTLADLVLQIRTIERQDTLQWLATLSPEALEQERRKWEAEHLVKDDESEEPAYNPLTTIKPSTASSFAFYDPVRKAQGYSNFKRVWGDRALSDNWRRSAQSSFEFGNPTDNGDSVVLANANPQTGDLFNDIPESPEQIEASNRMIMDALYRLAYIYKDQLENGPKAAETFEELITRFPANPYRAEVLYNLYLLYVERDPRKAANYKKMILEEFPESLFAKVILDPDFIEDSKEAERDLNTYYAQTYLWFEMEEWSKVIERTHQADSLFEDNFLHPQFDMLEALSYGRLGLLDTFQTLLEEIVNNYPQHEVKTRALEILHLLEGDRYRTDPGAARATFRFEPDSKHFLAIIMFEVGSRVAQVKNGLADYNALNHSLEGLKISSLLLDNNTEMIVVNAFPDAGRATEYYNEVRYNETVFGSIDKESYTVFPISEFNYGIFFREKDIPSYMQFFTQNYLGNN
jgi:tetratricopeptide (TPR) repeat protein